LYFLPAEACLDQVIDHLPIIVLDAFLEPKARPGLSAPPSFRCGAGWKGVRFGTVAPITAATPTCAASGRPLETALALARLGDREALRDHVRIVRVHFRERRSTGHVG
jgi:hypothetical protein